MNNKILVFVVAFTMLFSMTAWAGTSGSETTGSGNGSQTQDQLKLQDQLQTQTQDQLKLQDQLQTQTQDQLKLQDQTRLQDRVQTKIDQATQDQARLQLRERLHISDAAKTQEQDKARLQDQTRNGFSDVQQHWAREQITAAYNWGLINGYQNGSFNPNGNISGAEGIIMASRMMNSTSGTEDSSTNGAEDGSTNAAAEAAAPDAQIDLNAVPAWARETIREKTALRIAAQSQVYGETQLNRLQFAVMLANALNLDPASEPEGTVVFLDQEQIPAGDLGYINALRTLGVIEGSNGNFNPDQPVSRAEAACMMMRVVDTLDQTE